MVVTGTTVLFLSLIPSDGLSWSSNLVWLIVVPVAKCAPTCWIQPQAMGVPDETPAGMVMRAAQRRV
jgi:hypothetical protein